MRYDYNDESQQLIFSQSTEAYSQERINTQTHQFLMSLFALMDDSGIHEALYSIIVQYMGHERVCDSSPATFYQNARFLRAFNRFHPLSNSGGYRRDFRRLLESSTPELDAKTVAEGYPEDEVAITYSVVNGDEKPGYITSKDGKVLLRVFDRYYNDELYSVPNGTREIAPRCFTSPGFWSGTPIQYVCIPASVEKIAYNFSDPMYKIKALHLQTNEEHAYNRIKASLHDFSGSVISNTVYDFLTKWMISHIDDLISHIGDLISSDLLGCFQNIGLNSDLYSIVLCYLVHPLVISDLYGIPTNRVSCFNPDQKALDEYGALLNTGLVLRNREGNASSEPVTHLEEPVGQENNQRHVSLDQKNQPLAGNVGLFSSNAPEESLGLPSQSLEYDKDEFINQFREHYRPSFYSTQWGLNLEVLQQSGDPRALVINHAQNGGTQTRRALEAMGELPQENNQEQATTRQCLIM